MNLEKKTTEMSSEGPKMVERIYGVAGNGLKWPENQENTGGRRRRFAGPIPARPAAIGHEILRTASSGCPPPTCMARVQ